LIAAFTSSILYAPSDHEGPSAVVLEASPRTTTFSEELGVKVYSSSKVNSPINSSALAKRYLVPFLLIKFYLLAKLMKTYSA